jgi:eukaryotic-like serine/threonine-protein kinase
MIRAIGPYQLVRRLGRGGMAEVHLALAHGASGFERHVAIKMLAPELAGEPELERALIREATLAGTLHHRNLVAVLGLGVHDGSYYVVMEYVDGTDLARHLDGTAPPFGGAAGRGQAPTVDGALPEPLALHVVHELAIGLGYLHAAAGAHGLPLGIVHRDVGPANVLVSTTGDVKLGDFGIAKATALADLTAAGARKGRYAYMAPEQLAGEPVTGAADQFGLGVTLVELATGARPFAGELPWTLRDAIRGGLTPTALDGLAPDLAAIAARTLAFDARDRYASVDELRAAIAVAQRQRAPATAIELGAWVRARLAAG